MAIELEDLKVIAEMMKTPQPSQHPAPHSTPVPVVQVKDRDSFASFTTGLKDNWVFLMALFGFGMWLLTNIFQINTTNLSQDKNITTLELNQQQITTTVNTFVTDQNASNAEIVRKLDSLQKDIDIISGKE